MATKQHYLQQLSTLSVLLISAAAALGQSTSILSIVPTARNTEMGRLEFWGKNTPRSRMQISGAETIASNFAWILPGALPTVNSTLLVSTVGAVTYGAGPNAFVQLTGDQSPINGVKSWYGAQRWFGTNYLRNVSTSRDIMIQDIGGLYWLRGADGAGAMGNPIRASIWQYTGLGAEGGSISVHTGNAGAETTTASMSLNGVDTSVGYNINGGRVIDSDSSADFTSITVGGNLEVNPSAVLGIVAGGQRFAIGGFDGVGPVASYGGRLRLYNVDGVTSKFGIGHANGAMPDALNGYAVGGSTVIDSGRAGYFTNVLMTGTGTVNGNLSVIGGTVTRDVEPAVDNASFLGTTSKRWATYVGTSAQLLGGSLSVSNAGGGTTYVQATSGGLSLTNGATLVVSAGLAIDSSRNGFFNSLSSGAISGTTGNFATSATASAYNIGGAPLMDGARNLYSNTLFIGTAFSERQAIASDLSYATLSFPAPVIHARSQSWYYPSSSVKYADFSTSGGISFFNSTGLSTVLISPALGWVITSNNVGSQIAYMTNLGFDLANGGKYYINGTSGLTQVLNVRNAADTAGCTITITGGIATATTC